MTLLWMDGFDAGDQNVKGWSWTSSPVSGGTDTRFGSGRSLAMGSGNLQYRRPVAATAGVFLGVAFRTDSVSNLDNMIEFFTSDNTLHTNLVATGATTLSVRRGGTVLGTATTPVTLFSWGNYLEVSTVIHATSGSVVVRSNGNTIYSFSGNTLAGGTGGNVTQVGIGGRSSYVDDFYVCDASGSAPHNTFLGDVRVLTISPTGAGSSTQFTPDSGSNYARVNETPYSATNYVQSGTTGDRDTYAMADLSGSPTILGVQTCVVAKKTDAGAMSLKAAIKSGASVYYGSTTSLATSDATLADLRVVDPNTSSAWSASGVNALEAGMEVA